MSVFVHLKVFVILKEKEQVIQPSCRCNYKGSGMLLTESFNCRMAKQNLVY